MIREEIETILEDMGWVNTEQVITSEGNKSVYIRWVNSADTDVYVGNYYIEIATRGDAFPYKDACSTRQEIIDFLLG